MEDDIIEYLKTEIKNRAENESNKFGIGVLYHIEAVAKNAEILANKYNSSVSDDSAFVVTDALNGRIQYSGDHLANALSTPLANTIKCSIFNNYIIHKPPSNIVYK